MSDLFQVKAWFRKNHAPIVRLCATEEQAFTLFAQMTKARAKPRRVVVERAGWKIRDSDARGLFNEKAK